MGVGGGVFQRDKVCSAAQVTPSIKKKINTHKYREEISNLSPIVR